MILILVEWAVFLLLVITMTWNLFLLQVAIGDWQVVVKNRLNGSLQVLAFSRVRHKLTRLLIHITLIVLMAPRILSGDVLVADGHWSMLVAIAVVMFVDVAADAYDMHMLKWYLASRKKEKAS